MGRPWFHGGGGPLPYLFGECIAVHGVFRHACTRKPFAGHDRSGGQDCEHATNPIGPARLNRSGTVVHRISCTDCSTPPASAANTKRPACCPNWRHASASAANGIIAARRRANPAAASAKFTPGPPGEEHHLGAAAKKAENQKRIEPQQRSASIKAVVSRIACGGMFN